MRLLRAVVASAPDLRMIAQTPPVPLASELNMAVEAAVLSIRLLPAQPNPERYAQVATKVVELVARIKASRATESQRNWCANKLGTAIQRRIDALPATHPGNNASLECISLLNTALLAIDTLQQPVHREPPSRPAPPPAPAGTMTA